MAKKGNQKLQDQDSKGKRNDQIEHVPSEGFLDFYSNSAQVTLTKYDIQFVFGLLVPAKFGQERPKAEQRVAVIMSYEHAKAFSDLLTRQIEKGEMFRQASRPAGGQEGPKPQQPELVKKPVRTTTRKDENDSLMKV